MNPNPPTLPSPARADSLRSSESAVRGLWTVFARSVRDNAIAEVTVQVLRFGGLIVLARCLTPDDFGLFRILLVASALAMLVNESGIPDALVQRQLLTADHKCTAWFLSCALAIASSAVLFFTAPAIASIMKMPRLDTALRLLCVPIFLEGTAVTSNALLRRGFRFGVLAVADVAAEAGFLAVSLAVLWQGHPRLSLIAGLSARFAFHAGTIWIANPFLPDRLPRMEAARDLARFSASVAGSRLIYTLSSNADFLLVGRLLGSSALGYYSMAWDLLRFIPDRLYRVAGRVTLPAFCRLQDDTPNLRKAYRNFFGYLCRIVVPIVGCAAIAAPELIGFLYGSKWIPVATPLRLLAPGLILMGLRCGIGSVYYAKDHPSFDIYLHSVRLVLIVIVVALAAQLGLNAVSIGMSAVEGTISIAGQWMACALIGLGITDLIQDSVPGVTLALLCALSTIPGKTIPSAQGMNRMFVLALIAVPAAVVFIWREAGNAADIVRKAFTPIASAHPDFSEERA